MKRITALFLALLMVLGLAACAAKTEPLKNRTDDGSGERDRGETAHETDGDDKASGGRSPADVGNFINGGVFLLNGDGQVWFNGAVPRLMEADGSDMDTVDLGRPGLGMRFVEDDWIYVFTIGDENNVVDFTNARMGYLLRVRTDGSDCERILCLDEAPVSPVHSNGMQVYVQDGWAYLSSMSGLFRVRIDGSETEVLTETCVLRFDICDDRIYAVDCEEGVLFRMELDGSGREDLAAAEPPAQMSVLVEDGWAYYGFPQTGLFRVPVEGGAVEQVVEAESFRYFNLSDGWLYCVNVERDEEYVWSLYRVSVDGRQKEVLCEDLLAVVEDDASAEELESIRSTGFTGAALCGDWALICSYGSPRYIWAVRTDGSEVEARIIE